MTTKEYLVAAMDWEGASALTVLDLSFLDNASSWSKFLWTMYESELKTRDPKNHI